MEPQKSFAYGERAFSARVLLVWVLLLGTLGAVYWSTLSYGPVVDDPLQIELVQSYDGFSDAFGTDSSNLFRPVKNIAFYLFARDGDLFYLRVASLLLFTSFGTAYYLFASRFIKFEWALFSALLVVLHPAQVATAIFPSAINNIFSALFILLFCCVAVDYLSGVRGSRSAVPLLLLFGGLALFGYELAVGIVPLSVLLAFYFRKSVSLWRGVCLVALSLVLVGAYLLVRGNQNAIEEMTHPMIPPSASDFELFCSAPFYTLKHLGMALFPIGQGGILLSDDPRGAFFKELPYWGLLGFLGVAALWSVARGRSRMVFGFLFFVFAMTPLSNWIPLRNGPIANYYLLLPICGLVLAVGALFERWSSRSRLQSRVCLFVGAGLLGLSAAGGAYRASWWDSQHSIYEFTARNHPENWVAWNNWGVTLVARDESDLALEAFENSVRSANWYVDPYENRMWLLLLLGRNAEVVELVEARGERFSSGIAAAAAIAYAKEGVIPQAAEYGRQVERGKLQPAQRKWLDRALEDLSAR